MRAAGMIRMQSGCGVSSSCCAAGPPDGHARQPAGCTAAISSRRSRGRSADLRFATYALPQISEIAPTGKALIGLWPCELVKRDPLGPGIRQLSTGAVRDLETHGNFHLAVAELCNRPIKIGHSVDQDRLISLEMLGEQQRRRMRIQPDHRDACPERLNREDQFRAQSTAEMRHVGGDVTAGEVDEVEPIEHSESLRRGRPSALRLSDRRRENLRTPPVRATRKPASRSRVQPTTQG
jgi:hypothetical protein